MAKKADIDAIAKQLTNYDRNWFKMPPGKEPVGVDKSVLSLVPEEIHPTADPTNHPTTYPPTQPTVQPPNQPTVGSLKKNLNSLNPDLDSEELNSSSETQPTNQRPNHPTTQPPTQPGTQPGSFTRNAVRLGELINQHRAPTEPAATVPLSARAVAQVLGVNITDVKVRLLPQLVTHGFIRPRHPATTKGTVFDLPYDRDEMALRLVEGGPSSWTVGHPFPTWIPTAFVWLTPTHVDRLLEIHGSAEAAEVALDKLATNGFVRNRSVLLLRHLENPGTYPLLAEDDRTYLDPAARQAEAAAAERARAREAEIQRAATDRAHQYVETHRAHIDPTIRQHFEEA